jgi:hypothetical protein
MNSIAHTLVDNHPVYYPWSVIASMAVHDLYGDHKSNWQLVLDVLSWIFWSNATILLNKWIINSTDFRMLTVPTSHVC